MVKHESTTHTQRGAWIHGSIYMMHVLDCMARAADEMDHADVSICRNKILVGEMCYFTVNVEDKI